MKREKKSGPDPLVSLIIVTHNHTHLLPRLLDSILAQSFKRLEAIIVDDCSDTPCDMVVQAYAAKGLDVRLIRCPRHIFTRAARLTGVRAARADILAFADADDILWGTDALARHVDLLQKSGADAVHFRSVLVDEEMNFSGFCSYHDPFASALEGPEIFRRYLLAGVPGTPVWTKLYAKSLWLKILPVAERSAVDRYSEDDYLTALLSFHMRRYIGSEHCGYAHYLVGERTERFAGRAVAAYLLLKELTPYFMAEGCPEEVLRLWIKSQKERICLYAGRFCRQLTLVGGFEVRDEELEAKLHGVDRALLFKALLVGNGMNARKITHCLQAIYSAPE
jgi:glycosyltransferase involved in cell wall biosynthesis